MILLIKPLKCCAVHSRRLEITFSWRLLNTAELEDSWKWEREEEEDRKVRKKWKNSKKTHNSIQSMMMLLDMQLNELQGRFLLHISKLNEWNIPVLKSGKMTQLLWTGGLGSTCPSRMVLFCYTPHLFSTWASWLPTDWTCTQRTSCWDVT